MFCDLFHRIKNWLHNAKKHRGGIPAEVIESLVETFLPDIQAFFASEEGQQEFAAWQKQREQETITRKTV